MKCDPQRRQADLFDGDPRPLPILPSQQDELVDLLSQLLWQVASAPTVMTNQEGSDEQDRT